MDSEHVWGILPSKERGPFQLHRLRQTDEMMIRTVPEFYREGWTAPTASASSPPRQSLRPDQLRTAVLLILSTNHNWHSENNLTVNLHIFATQLEFPSTVKLKWLVHVTV